MAALGKSHIVLVIEVASSILYIVVLYVCVSRFGIVGAAMAFLIWGISQALVRIPVANYELNKYMSHNVQRLGRV